MKVKTLLASVLMTLTINANAQSALISTVNGMTNDQLWTALLSINLNNETIFGKCKISDATQCASCACDYYFRSDRVGSLGMYGWPKNPLSGDSTGCNNGTQWGGYTPAMATSDKKANARAMLLHALNANACAPATPVVITDSINVSDSVKILFVNPSQTGGKIKCGTTNLGPQIAGSPQLTKLDEEFCVSAYYMALSAVANGRIPQFTPITLAQYNNYNPSATTALASATLAGPGQLNQSYTLFDLGPITSQTPIQSFVDSPVALGTNQKQILKLALTAVGLPYSATEIVQNPSGTAARLAPLDNSITLEFDTLKTQTVPSLNITTIEGALAAPTTRTTGEVLPAI